MTDKKISSNNTYPSSRVAWSGVTVFTILYILSYADRKLLSLLVGPIQQDLNISDFQFGLLQGFAFSLLYVVAGIPIGRLVDRKPRRMIIYLGVTFWSICTAAIGYAQNFVTLLLLRCGVGVGEATLSPASYSMMSDLFPKEKVTTAIGVYGTGVTIGGGIAFILGGSLISLINSVGGIDLGILGTFKAWQLAFLLAGVPGLLLAFLIFTVPEPKRMGVAKKSDVSKSELWGFMRTRKAFLLYHFIGFALVGTWSFSVSSWAPAFYGRKFGVSPMEMGIGLGIYTGIFGTSSRRPDETRHARCADAGLRLGYARGHSLRHRWVPLSFRDRLVCAAVRDAVFPDVHCGSRRRRPATRHAQPVKGADLCHLSVRCIDRRLWSRPGYRRGSDGLRCG
jgi:MFS family permease